MVKVKPRASATSLQGFVDEQLVIRLAASPVDGKANQALIAYLAKTLGLKKAQIEIRAGHKSRSKVLFLKSVKADQVREALNRE